MHIDPDRPIYTLTVGEYISLHEDLLAKMLEQLRQSPLTNEETPEDLVYGIDGIARLFGVCHTTAQEYKNTFLQPCISQNGKIIVCKRSEALALFEASGRSTKNKKAKEA